MSLISYASFALSCAKFIQQQQTNSILNEINHNLVLLRDRNVKAGIEMMNDAKNCRNSSNMDFYIRSAYLKFVEAVQSYSADRDFEKMMEYFWKHDLSSSISWVPGVSSWRDSQNIKEKEYENAINYYQTACLGAGICSYYLGEYKNCYKYLDASLFSAIKLKNICDGLYYIADNIRIFGKTLSQMDFFTKAIIASCKESFDCFIDLEAKNEKYLHYPDSNLAKLAEPYHKYKSNYKNMFNKE